MSQLQVKADKNISDALTMIDIFVEQEFGEPETLRQLEGLVNAIETQPNKLLDKLRYKLDDARERYIEKLVCPSCGGKLQYTFSAYNGAGVACSCCDWGNHC